MFSTPDGRRAGQALLQFGGLGISFAAGVAVFSWAGWALDRRFGTAPVGLAVMCLLGAALGLYKIVRDVTRWSAAEDSAAEAESRKA